ncbi:MAG: hypothetical protein Ct9H300mP25_16410 [Acidobacteriota bacterium]|nr:MAG: hypothetical protein Ct9H300mP25_16410 [Acidobacteriota bacterium]
MTRTPVLAANWKMHKTIKEAVNFTEAFFPKSSNGYQCTDRDRTTIYGLSNSVIGM